MPATKRTIARKQPYRIIKPDVEPKVNTTFQLEWSLMNALDERAKQLGIPKRDILVAGIKMALDSKEFKP